MENGYFSDRGKALRVSYITEITPEEKWGIETLSSRFITWLRKEAVANMSEEYMT